MARYEGLIKGIQPDGRAEVTIRPGKMGIPGAPEVSRRVCHSSTDGSIVTVDAVNNAGATIGDWVSVRQADGVARKNLLILFGIPLSGALLGVIGVVVVAQLTAVWHPILWLLLGGSGLLTGVIVSHRVYSATASHNQLIIHQVLKPAGDLTAQFGDIRTRMERAAASCGDCTQCLTDTTLSRRD